MFVSDKADEGRSSDFRLYPGRQRRETRGSPRSLDLDRSCGGRGEAGAERLAIAEREGRPQFTCDPAAEKILDQRASASYPALAAILSKTATVSRPPDRSTRHIS